MGNSRTRSVNYKPRYTQMEAYDMLPKKVRDAMKEGPSEWDTGFFLREYRKLLKEGYTEEHAEDYVARYVWRTHNREVAEGKPWRPRKPGQRWRDVPPSPHNMAKATMQLANY